MLRSLGLEVTELTGRSVQSLKDSLRALESLEASLDGQLGQALLEYTSSVEKTRAKLSAVREKKTAVQRTVESKETEERQCVICLSADRSAVLHSCGHRCLCKGCAE